MSSNATTAADLDELAAYLQERSKEICSDNKCTEEDHFCESYAYFDVEIRGNDLTKVGLVDICCSDYLQRTVNCAIGLPFEGDGAELLDRILSETDWSEDDEDRVLLRDTEDDVLPTIVGQLKTAWGEAELRRRVDNYGGETSSAEETVSE